ncbi:hypothetical protein GCK32_004905 [Trichostrongylus colubriformis]|uniref:Large ribosomal subunit protein uL14m n=1 Tax=Trichostrongylus colubriformis TaxID=6319 RepID=A0AAN8IB00_TRICO
MDLAAMLAKCGSAATRLLSRIYTPATTSVQFASGRWYPQPVSCSSTQQFSTKMTTTSSEIVVPTTKGDIRLVKESAAPVYYKPKGEGKTGFELIPWKNGEQIANYVLFEASMERAKVPWNDYNRMTKDERTIYMAHLKAVQQRALVVAVVVGIALTGTKTLVMMLRNLKYELSKHRSRPPCMGIQRRTRLNVVDNSALGKEAHTSGKRAYCIDVYKQGRRKKHLPHATLGDKILVAIRGQMRKAYVVGAQTHVHLRKHGIPVTDTNNIVLLDEEGNPLGNRVTAPIPVKLLEKKDRPQFAKVLALANKFI